jgi:hypothetical protein
MFAIEEFWVALIICSIMFNYLQNLCFLKFLTSSVDFDARIHTWPRGFHLAWIPIQLGIEENFQLQLTINPNLILV